MRLIENGIYHIYNRANGTQKLFFTDANYLFFISKIRDYLKPICEILSYSLMPNHFHLIIQANEASCRPVEAFVDKQIQQFSYQLGIVLSSYTQAVNKQRNRRGSLFQQKTKCKFICPAQNALVGQSENYLINCIHYVHQNALRANLVKALLDWRYSSFPEFYSPREGMLCNMELFQNLTGYDMNAFYMESLRMIAPGELITIRKKLRASEEVEVNIQGDQGIAAGNQTAT